MILKVCWDDLWTLPFGLSQFRGHGSWLVCEAALMCVFLGMSPDSSPHSLPCRVWQIIRIIITIRSTYQGSTMTPWWPSILTIQGENKVRGIVIVPTGFANERRELTASYGCTDSVWEITSRSWRFGKITNRFRRIYTKVPQISVDNPKDDHNM